METQRTVLLTGATGKLGRSFALGFADATYNVVFTARRKEFAEALRAECIEAGARSAEYILTDLADASAGTVINGRLLELNLSPTVLVNNARDVGNLRVNENGKIPREGWLGEFQLGVVTPYELTMALARARASKLKSVINIASMYGVTAPNLRLYDDPERQSPANYGVVKAALIQLTKELAVRLASSGVRVNAISFGGVDGRVSDEFRERYKKLCPANRMLQDSEVFGAVRFLASDESTGMTGHNLVVDGGWTVW
jgi:NAD(P)-dependent dehydrogenase (short-subunit alcohol dehydrogenase family)